MNNTKLITAEAAENIITNALRTAAEAYEKIASTPNSEGMHLTKQLREQFIRQAQEAEALCVQIEEGITRIGQPAAHLIKFQTHNAHGPRVLQCMSDDADAARTVAQVLRGCGYVVNHQESK